ncbi:McrB family protein [Nucisporomicrobium flavum]|uniref:McrB family protein n=1 Tax=Nucisporomicrobium flavum TaxID=2785915 RepID=UPI0018F74343|nr:AAA family ATPase [Nucisporomicrobium flavum]
MALPDIDDAAVLATLQEFDELGRMQFLDRYGYGVATTYLLRHEGRFYDPKAVLGVAYRRTEHGVALKPHEFDATEAISRLGRLGFEVLPFNGIWWVNQGESYSIERDGGFVWAPLTDKVGRELGHHKNVNNLRVGQRTIHYVNGWIRAVGTVAAAPTVAPQPKALSRDTWINDGYLCAVDYRELEQRIARDDIPGRHNDVDSGIFATNGNVKLGYVYSVKPEYLFTLLEFLNQRIPDFFDNIVTHEHYVAEEQSGVMGEREPSNPIVSALRSFKNVVLEGVPGTGKTYAVEQVADDWKHMTGRDLIDFDGVPFCATVLHPSSSYEDFVEGLRPEVKHSGDATQLYFDEKPEGTGGFGIRDGFFLSVCARAVETPHKDVLVLLDELNRCNVPSVFGDLLLSLDKSRRGTHVAFGPEARAFPREARDWQAATPVTLPYSGRKFFVPDNVYVIATMNTTDRSVAPLDAAIRRRFAFHRLEPQMPEANILTETQPAATRELFARSAQVLTDLNQNALRPCLGPDAMIGHSYLYALAANLTASADLNAGIEELKTQWRYAILPQLIDSVRSFGGEDLLSVRTRDAWLARHADQTPAATAVVALDQLDEFLMSALDLRIAVEGVGLSRGARIEERVAVVAPDEVVADDDESPA